MYIVYAPEAASEALAVVEAVAAVAAAVVAVAGEVTAVVAVGRRLNEIRVDSNLSGQLFFYLLWLGQYDQ